MGSSIFQQVSVLRQENEALKAENELLRTEVSSLHSAFSSLLKVIEVAESATVNVDVFQLLDWIMKGALSSIEATNGSILLIDQETDELVFAVVSGSIQSDLIGHRMPQKKGIAGWVVHHKAPLLVPNVNIDPRFSPDIDRRFEFKTESLLCVPMIYEQKVLGVIQALNKQHNKEFSSTDLILLQVVAHLAAEAIHRIDQVLED